MKIERSCGIIPLIQNSGEWHVLLIHQINGNFWGFPKGHIDKGETDKACAERELLEETGLKIVKYLDTKPLESSYLFKKRGKTIDKQLTLFPAITTEDLKLQKNEVYAAQWFTLTDALAQISFSEGKKLILELSQILH
ncbi:MAG: NUDIX domain-containing protein [Simkaniaceae bacterium]|nr:NUDIX domain-containing protein [Simkaniaceae bacterium]